MMENSKTVLKCNSCDPSYKLGEINQRWKNIGKLAEYCKNFVGIQVYSNAPEDYNEKLDQLICPFCNNKLVDTKLPIEDFHIIGKVTDYNREILDLMIELHNNNLIEYQLKLNQFKLQQEQADTIREQQRNEHKLHCPYCNSTDVKKISGISKAGSVVLWGIFAAGKVSKNYHCNKCKADF